MSLRFPALSTSRPASTQNLIEVQMETRGRIIADLCFTHSLPARSNESLQFCLSRPYSPSSQRPGLVLITFASNPHGAHVSFSGMGICYTPCFTKLQPQRYKLKMKLAGYADWPGEIIVEAGKPATVVADLQR
jgi:hypothetical protein